MPESEEKEKSFKVQDRRRFTAEGETRESEADDEPRVETPPRTAAAEGASPREEQRSAAQPRPAAGADRATLELSFSTFLVGLSTEALAALGEMPDPATGDRMRDLRAAQQMIDIIAMLGEKTRGNLDADEQHLIEAILFDLRMKYVELAGAPAR